MTAVKEREEIRRKLKRIAQVDDSLVVAEVLSVDTEKNTCEVKPQGHAELVDVRLKAAIDALNHYVVEIPKVGSSVIVGQMKGAAVIVKCNEIEEWKYFLTEEHRFSVSAADGLSYQKGDVLFSINDNGTHIEKGGKDLLSELMNIIAEQSSLIDEVIKVIVVNGTSPNIPALTAIQQQLEGPITDSLNEVLY